VHNMQRMALDFAEQYQKYGDGLLSHVIWVTDDGTAVSFVNVETKEELKQPVHIHETKK
jgi:hypothetical protein